MTAAAILTECLATPDDDAPRLVWADAIGGERGELVGLQCGRDAVTPAQLAARNRRERELIASYGMAWSGLEGLVRRVRFRRGFVDAIELDTDVWLAQADRIVAQAPFLTSIALAHHHPKYVTREGRAEARERLELVVTHPAFARIRALAITDRVTELDYAWGDVAASVLASTGALAQLEALALPYRFTEAGIPAVIRGAPELVTRLWLRDSMLRPDELQTLLRAMPRLDDLDIGALQLDVESLPLPRLRSLRLRRATAESFVRVAASPLAPHLEQLALEPGSRSDRLGPGEIARLAQFPRLRALELHGELCEDAAALEALASVELPALRELRMSWTTSRPVLERVVDRLIWQLEVLDLRTTQRIHSVPCASCDVLVDEPRVIELLHAGPRDRGSWRVASEVYGIGRPVDTDAWLAEVSGSDVRGRARVWELGMFGDRWIRIGRGGMCDVVLLHDSIARTHAVLEWQRGSHRIKDMGSTNGTMVDGELIDQRLLRDGMRIQLGGVSLRYFVGPGGGERATACVMAPRD
jgi:hypothetical protein